MNLAGETPPFYTKIAIGHLALEGSMWVGDEVEGISNEIFITPSTLKWIWSNMDGTCS